MFSYKNKLDKNLSYYVNNKSYKKYRVLIKCRNLQDSIAKKITSYKGELLYSLKYPKIICAKLNANSINRLIEYPEVSYVCFDEYLYLCGISVSAANGIPSTYKNKLTGKGIYIGVVDSGVYPHDDILSPNSKIDTFIDLINNYKYLYDDNGHGTCTCGILSSSGISSNYMYKGIAPDSKLVCYKAFDKLGKGFASDILFSVESLINDKRIKVLCLPFELLSHNHFITNAFNDLFLKAIERNITPVVPSGSNYNKEEGSIMGIATLNSCITVGGVNTFHALKSYDYSSSGPFGKTQKPNLSASCANIVSLNCNPSFIPQKDDIKLYPSKLEALYKSFSGTSIATAFVSGIISLIYENNLNITFEDVKSILSLSCELGDLSKHSHGEGLINFSKLMT